MSTYNGWTNYATWRINLEFFEDYQSFAEFDADDLRRHVEAVLAYEGSGVVLDYALAFVQDVNWHEISIAIAEETV